MSKIIVYEGNTITLTDEVLNADGTDAVLTGFTATLTIKQNKADTTTLLTSTGSITDNVISFTITDTANTLSVGVYYYEVTIESTTETYTVCQDRLVVKESIVYIT